MIAAIYALSYAFLIFALVGEASSVWLQVIGFLMATWMTVAGAIAGWQHFRG